VYLWRHRAYFATDTEPTDDATLAAMKPASIFVGAVGLGMAVLAISFVRYQLGAAPPEEPISATSGDQAELNMLGGRWCGLPAVSGPVERSWPIPARNGDGRCPD
jgi:hypothetical protein